MRLLWTTGPHYYYGTYTMLPLDVLGSVFISAPLSCFLLTVSAVDSADRYVGRGVTFVGGELEFPQGEATQAGPPPQYLITYSDTHWNTFGHLHLSARIGPTAGDSTTTDVMLFVAQLPDTFPAATNFSACRCVALPPVFTVSAITLS